MWSAAPAEITMAGVPLTSTPAVPASQEIVSALVMVTAPKPPGSRQLISPAGAVLEIAPAKVLQGAVRLQGLASSPTPETQVRVAWALAGADAIRGNNNPAAIASRPILRRMVCLLCADLVSKLVTINPRHPSRTRGLPCGKVSIRCLPWWSGVLPGSLQFSSYGRDHLIQC